MSSASSRDSKRVQAAILRSPAEPAASTAELKTELKPEASDAGTAEAAPKASRVEPVAERSALALKRHRSHSMDNRPVDPSPINVSHTVRMAGQRPIGVSDNRGKVDFSKSPTILNRPIAPNSTADDKAMVEYLD